MSINLVPDRFRRIYQRKWWYAQWRRSRSADRGRIERGGGASARRRAVIGDVPPMGLVTVGPSTRSAERLNNVSGSHT
jgi:hypothetical protein